MRRRVNYGALDVEELGSVYESLLDEQPLVTLDTAGRQPHFSFVSGMERKTTGSYYTPRELVNEVIKSALLPVIEDRLAQAGDDQKAREQALLGLNVCDPACGSGHFLLAAARRIGYELARVRSGADEPAPEGTRAATREVITHCIYGVDKNPLAVDLCKVALWIEGHSRGKPLTFLDYRIRCGDSLVGVLDMSVLDEGIPNEAYKTVSGDDSRLATALRRQNRAELAGQMSLLDQFKSSAELLDAGDWQTLENLPEDTPEEINAKRAAFDQLHAQADKARTAADLWTSAFFSTITQDNLSNIPTTDTLRRYQQGQNISAQVVGSAMALSEKLRFFHWPLEFPHVFANDGFDTILGNPPWDIIQLDETRTGELAYYKLKEWYKVNQYKVLKGRRDLYKLFITRAKDLICNLGLLGFLVPFGMFVEDDSTDIRRDLYLNGSVISLQHFQNRKKKFFPNVDSRTRFVSITYSPLRHVNHRFSTVIRLPEEIGKEIWVSITRNELELRLGESVAAILYPNRQYVELHSILMNRLKTTPEQSFEVLAEFHATSDKHLMTKKRKSDSDLQLLKNRSIHQFNHRFAEGGDFISEATAKEKCLLKGLDPLIWVGNASRLLFRDIARNDDARTLICCLAPPGFVSSYDTPMVLPEFEDKNILDTQLAYFCGIFNSFVFDFLIRPFVDKHIKGYILKRLSVPLYNCDNSLMSTVSKEVKYLSRVCSTGTTEESEILKHWANIDAAVAHLLGLTVEELNFILETFPIIRREQENVFGEYFSKRLAVEAWNSQLEAIDSNALLWPQPDPGSSITGSQAKTAPAISTQSPKPTITKTARLAAKPKAEPLTKQPKKKTLPTKSPQQLSIPQVHLPDLSIAAEGGFNQRLKRVQKLSKDPTPAEIAELTVYLTAPESSIRWLAGASLAQIGGPNAIAALEALLKQDIDDMVRENVAKVLTQIEAKSG